MRRPLDWTGSTWEQVCTSLFASDEARMLAWGLRYLAAHPDVNRREFHLGAEFRRIVGARNREQWWHSGVRFLERRAAWAEAARHGAATAGSAARGAGTAASVTALSVRDSETPAVYGTHARSAAAVAGTEPTGTGPGAPVAAGSPRIAWPRLTSEERLRSFDEATERQRRRERGLPAIEPHSPPRDRGWTREELYDRDRRR